MMLVGLAKPVMTVFLATASLQKPRFVLKCLHWQCLCGYLATGAGHTQIQHRLRQVCSLGWIAGLFSVILRVSGHEAWRAALCSCLSEPPLHRATAVLVSRALCIRVSAGLTGASKRYAR